MRLVQRRDVIGQKRSPEGIIGTERKGKLKITTLHGIQSPNPYNSYILIF
ncbi:unnamed protein product [Nezara viridula]|uniref:Uncharacterized protein n=1 Tax=Nezara viridula TaxID=85310 RepID=A0A9P0GZC9_NEZVI|nr:unnamed protein product [Nezara viridula]